MLHVHMCEWSAHKMLARCVYVYVACVCLKVSLHDKIIFSCIFSEISHLSFNEYGTFYEKEQTNFLKQIILESFWQ